MDGWGEMDTWGCGRKGRAGGGGGEGVSRYRRWNTGREGSHLVHPVGCPDKRKEIVIRVTNACLKENVVVRFMG
jgi:hypothetical protein